MPNDNTALIDEMTATAESIGRYNKAYAEIAQHYHAALTIAFDSLSLIIADNGKTLSASLIAREALCEALQEISKAGKAMESFNAGSGSPPSGN